jgi:hypothetical protein
VSNALALMFDEKARRTSDFSHVSVMMTGREGRSSFSCGRSAASRLSVKVPMVCHWKRAIVARRRRTWAS